MEYDIKSRQEFLKERNIIQVENKFHKIDETYDDKQIETKYREWLYEEIIWQERERFKNEINEILTKDKMTKITINEFCNRSFMVGCYDKDNKYQSFTAGYWEWRENKKLDTIDKIIDNMIQYQQEQSQPKKKSR